MIYQMQNIKVNAKILNVITQSSKNKISLIAYRKTRKYPSKRTFFSKVSLDKGRITNIYPHYGAPIGSSPQSRHLAQVKCSVNRGSYRYSATLNLALPPATPATVCHVTYRRSCLYCVCRAWLLWRFINLLLNLSLLFDFSRWLTKKYENCFDVREKWGVIMFLLHSS